MVGFSVGFGCIPFLLLGELFPAEQRSVLSSIAGSFNLGVMFIVIKTYHYLEKVRIMQAKNRVVALITNFLSFFFFVITFLQHTYS